ncbi:MAG: substrate-binding domain-containing protein [Verrucomicrobiota bacterium]
MGTTLPAHKKIRTQQAVALASNLSRATVGKVLGGGANALLFSEETRQRVWAAAHRIGYHPNRAAQAMRKGRSNLIAIIYHSSSYEVGRRAASFLPLEIKKQGFDYLVFDYHWHGSSLEEIIREVIQLRVEGVLFLGLPANTFTPEHAKWLHDYGIAVVGLDNDEDHFHGKTVVCNSQPAIESLTRHLLALGHRHILMLLIKAESRGIRERADGFRHEISRVGDFEDLTESEFFGNPPSQGLPRKTNRVLGQIIRLPWQENSQQNSVTENTCQFCRRLFATGMPDAIMCSNDAEAIGVFLAAHEAGVEIPRDVAVTGYDDDDLAHYPMFDLTTARQNVEESCLAAVECLVNQLRGGEMSGESKVFQPSLVLRGSCGRHLAKGGDKLQKTGVARARQAPKNTPGFTLVEMLVTIMIIAVLATLMFSGLKSAQASANAAVCIGNLRTLGTGFANYAAENSNQFPNYAQGGYWPAKIAEYVPRKAFFCPVDVAAGKKGSVLMKIAQDKIWTDNQPFISYGYNYRYLAPDFGSGWAVPRARDDITYTRISRLSGVMLLADAGRLNTDRKSGWGFYVMEPPALDYSMPLPRHRDQANVLWTDGSVSQSKCVLVTLDGYKYITQKNWDWRLP